MDDLLREFDASERIPRVVHQTCPRKDALPEPLRALRERLMVSNPGWEFRLYDDQDIVAFLKSLPNLFLETYLRINHKYGAARADFFRYLVVYVHGGVYLDIKSSLKVSLEQIVSKSSNQFVLTQWDTRMGRLGPWCCLPVTARRFTEASRCPTFPQFSNVDFELGVAGGEFNQWQIVSPPHHPFLYAAIAGVVENIGEYDVDEDGVGKDAVLRVTGPAAYTRAIVPLLHRYPHAKFESWEEAGFVYRADESLARNVLGVHYSQLAEPLILPSADAEGNQRRSPDQLLVIGCKTGDLDAMNCALQRGANARASRKGWNCLGIALFHGQFDAAKLLVEVGGANPQAQINDGGLNALHLSCEYGDLAAVRYFVECGAPTDAALACDGRTPLHLASFHGHSNCVQYLAPRTVDINAFTLSGMTALMMASLRGHFEVTQRLLGAGADPTKRTRGGLSSYDIACRHQTCTGHFLIILLLAWHGAEWTIVGLAQAFLRLLIK